MAIRIKIAFYLIFIGALVINVMSYNPMLTYTLRFKKMEVQPNITTDYYTVDRYKEGEFLNGQITINSKELINKVIAVFYRCDPDGINCEYFQTWTLSGICAKLKEKNQIWSRWYGSLDPPAVCPLDKVTYRIKNATVDIGTVLLLYPLATDYQWRVVQKFYSDDIFIGSYTMEVTYQIKNGTIDVSMALLLYPQVTDYQWKVNQKFYSDDIFIGSYMLEFYFFGYRKKLKSIFKL